VPSINLLITPQGPIATLRIGASRPRRDALQKANQPIPGPVDAQLLIDTGASCTCLDPWIIQKLQLTPSGLIDIHTPSTTANNAHACHQYDVTLIIPHPGISRSFNAIPVLESNLKHQGIDGLMGRDVLSHCLFVYNGELKIYTLSF
jgi:hypothetical protein